MNLGYDTNETLRGDQTDLATGIEDSENDKYHDCRYDPSMSPIEAATLRVVGLTVSGMLLATAVALHGPV